MGLCYHKALKKSKLLCLNQPHSIASLTHRLSFANVILIQDLIDSVRQIVSRRKLTHAHLMREEVPIFKSTFSFPVSRDEHLSQNALRFICQSVETAVPAPRLRGEACLRSQAFWFEGFEGKQFLSVLMWGDEGTFSFAAFNLPSQVGGAVQNLLNRAETWWHKTFKQCQI